MNRQVVYIGVSYRSKGGIASVMQLYKNYFRNSLFFASRGSGRVLLDACTFPFRVLYFIFFMMRHPGMRIVHIHGASRGSFYRKYVYFLVSRYLFRKRVVYHIHGGGFKDFYHDASGVVKKMIRHFMGTADAVICVSESWRRCYVEHFHPKHIVAIPNMIEKITTRHYAERQEKVIFLFLGKIMSAKGVYDLLDVAADLQLTHAGKFEIWIGGNGEVQQLQQQVAEKKLEAAVQYEGWVSGEEKDAIFRKADVFVLPSYHEGLPVSILEAMSYGMPVIATKVGGIPEVVSEGESGLLIDAGDKDALKKSMLRFINDHRLIRRMGNISQNIIRKGYVAEAVILQLEEVYHHVLY